MIGGILDSIAYYSPYQSAVSGAAQRQAQPVRGAQSSPAVWTAQKAAQPESPVQPVAPVRPVSGEEGDPAQAAMLRYGSDPAAMAVRMRIQYPEEAARAQAGADAAQSVQQGEDVKSAQEVMEESECQTCKERKYQDGSDDPGVSFKTPTNIAPEQAASAVRGHENQHVVREQAKAQREDRRVVSQSVTYHTAICPECGKAYVSGGTTRTTTKADPQQEVQPQDDAKQSQRVPFSAVA